MSDFTCPANPCCSVLGGFFTISTAPSCIRRRFGICRTISRPRLNSSGSEFSTPFSLLWTMYKHLPHHCDSPVAHISDSNSHHGCCKTLSNSVAGEPLWADRLRADRSRADRLRADRLWSDRLRADRLRADRSRADRLRADRLRSDRLRSDRLRSDRLRSDRLRSDRFVLTPGGVLSLLVDSGSAVEALSRSGLSSSTFSPSFLPFLDSLAFFDCVTFIQSISKSGVLIHKKFCLFNSFMLCKLFVQKFRQG